MPHLRPALPNSRPARWFPLPAATAFPLPAGLLLLFLLLLPTLLSASPVCYRWAGLSGALRSRCAPRGASVPDLSAHTPPHASMRLHMPPCASTRLHMPPHASRCASRSGRGRLVHAPPGHGLGQRAHQGEIGGRAAGLVRMALIRKRRGGA